MKNDPKCTNSATDVFCVTSAFFWLILAALAWLILAALYQIAQSLAWLWQLVTGGAE